MFIHFNFFLYFIFFVRNSRVFIMSFKLVSMFLTVQFYFPIDEKKPANVQQVTTRTINIFSFQFSHFSLDINTEAFSLFDWWSTTWSNIVFTYWINLFLMHFSMQTMWWYWDINMWTKVEVIRQFESEINKVEKNEKQQNKTLDQLFNIGWSAA